MKIHAYRVHQRGARTLEAVLSNLAARPHEDRFFEGTAEGLRLEHMETRGDLVFADIAVQRTGHGPARMRLDAPLADFDLADGEAFGEDTGFVYSPSTGYAAVQYNHVGPRIGRIYQYLYAADLSLGLGTAVPGVRDEDRCGFSFGAVLRPDAYVRLRQMGIFRTFEFTVSLPGVLAEDRQAGRSLAQVLSAPLPAGVEKITVTLKASPQREGRLARTGVMGLVDDLQALGASFIGGKVHGKRDEDASVEDIDLIADRLELDTPMSVNAGQRYPREARWRALSMTLEGWLANGQLQVP